MAGCSDCFTCRDIWAGDPLGSIVYETTLVEGVDTWENLLDPDDTSLSGYAIPSYRAYTGDDDEDPLLDPFDGTVSTECVCVDFVNTDAWGAFPVYNPLFTEPVSDDCEALHTIISGYVYNNIDALSEETGFLTPSWNLEATSDMDLTDNLVLGAIAIYYAIGIVVLPLAGMEIPVRLYHTISRTGYGTEQLSLGFEGDRYVGGDTHYTTVILDELETEGLKEKFGGSDSDIEAALETEIEDLIAQITAGIIEAEYTFKKIKQPTVDVRLFSAFEEGQKEATQMISVETSATITTY